MAKIEINSIIMQENMKTIVDVAKNLQEKNSKLEVKFDSNTLKTTKNLIKAIDSIKKLIDEYTDVVKNDAEQMGVSLATFQETDSQLKICINNTSNEKKGF